MKCKECLIWQNRRNDLARLAVDSVDYCCVHKLTDIVNDVARGTRVVFISHISLMDNECPKNKCILVTR